MLIYIFNEVINYDKNYFRKIKSQICKSKTKKKKNNPPINSYYSNAIAAGSFTR